VLTRMGLRWRQGGKAKPQKKSTATDAIVAHRKKR
jgi:hypothetical protein